VRFTDEQYAKAIAHLEDARTQIKPNGNGCHCCGDSGHQAFECGHNPLVAMGMCHDIAIRAEALHDMLHKITDGHELPSVVDQALLNRLHAFLHTLCGACTYMGVQVGPARVVLP